MTDEKGGGSGGGGGLNYKRAMLKENQDLIPIQLIDQKIFSKVQEGSCYRFNHLIVSSFNQEKYL